MRCGMIGAIFIAVCIYRNVFSLWQLSVYHPVDGDVVFQSLPHGEVVDAIEGITGSPWSHCGVVVYEHHCWFVTEAIDKVRKTFLPLWIMRGRGGYFEAYRPRFRFPRATNHFTPRWITISGDPTTFISRRETIGSIAPNLFSTRTETPSAWSSAARSGSAILTGNPTRNLFVALKVVTCPSAGL